MIGSVYIPFFFIETYAIGLGVDTELSFYLLSVMNAASLLGRLVPNWLADQYGGMSIMIPCCLGTAIVLFLFRFVHNPSGLIIIAIVYGFVSGGMVALPPAKIANITDDPSEYGTRMGMGCTVASIGTLIGYHIGGATQRPRPDFEHSIAAVQGQFQGTWTFAGSFMLAAVIAMLTLRYLKFGSLFRGKC